MVWLCYYGIIEPHSWTLESPFPVRLGVFFLSFSPIYPKGGLKDSFLLNRDHKAFPLNAFGSLPLYQGQPCHFSAPPALFLGCWVGRSQLLFLDSKNLYECPERSFGTRRWLFCWSAIPALHEGIPTSTLKSTIEYDSKQILRYRDHHDEGFTAIS